MSDLNKQDDFPQRYPENSPGDFYVENQVCIACGAPEAEAPDLIDHSKTEYGHCYFKKQPRTEDEIDRAINAISVSCISGLRYGGRDEKILKRLYERGQGEQCDHKPIGSYKFLIWNKVIFNYRGTINELHDKITSEIIRCSYHPFDNVILNRKTSDKYCFDFVHRWTDGLTGTNYKCSIDDRKYYQIELSKEIDGYVLGLQRAAITLNLILCNDKSVSDIKWFDSDGLLYDRTQIR